MSTSFWRDLGERAGTTWTAVLDRRPYGGGLFYYRKCVHVFPESQTELLGIVGVSFCQNFATCAVNKCQFWDLIFVAGISYTSSCPLERPSGPRSLHLLNSVLLSSLLVHALHCQPKVQGNATYLLPTPTTCLTPTG